MTEILGKYRLVAELGRGGSAEVHLCIQTGPLGSGFSKLAVLKRLRADRADDPDFAAMLVDEARITARVRHPNVVQTFEVGLAGDIPFLAMEYLDGLPLHQLRRRAQKAGMEIPADVALLVIGDALAGLHHAHELTDYDGTPLHVVHRDVSPHNLFVTIDGAVKVVDFGIAKAMRRVVETQTGVVKGKVRYMAPEHAMGTAVDRRADVFSAGIILWELVVGKRFWEERDELNIVEALVRRTYNPSPRAVDPTISEELDRICRKALAADLTARYATCADFRADLDAYIGERAIEARHRLVALVTQLFADDRQKIRATVETAMKEVDLSRVSERSLKPRRAIDASEDSPSVGPFVVADATGTAEATGTDLAPTLVRGVRAEPTQTLIDRTFLGRIFPRKRFRAGAIVGASVAALVAGASALLVWAPYATLHASASALEPSVATSVHATLARRIYVRAPDAPPPSAPPSTARAPTPPPRAPARPPVAPRNVATKGAAPARSAPSRVSSQDPSLHLDTSDPWGRSR